MRSIVKVIAAAGLCALVGGTLVPAGAEPGDPRIDPPVVSPADAAVEAGLEAVSDLWSLPGFGRIVTEKDGVITVQWKGQVPAKAEMTFADLKPRGIAVEIVPVSHSLAEMHQAGRRVLDSERSRTGSAKHLTFIPNDDLSGAEVEVYSGSAAAKDLSASESTFSKAAGMPVVVKLVDWVRKPATRQNDSAPWQGGGAIAQNNDCSVGFAIIRNGAGRLLTAQHCGIGYGGEVRDGAGQRIGEVTNIATGYDSVLIDPDASPGTTGKVFGGPWNAGTTHPRYQMSVGGATGASNADSGCTSGAMTGEHCGLDVYHVGITFPCGANLAFSCDGFRVAASSGETAAAPGDSGGPVYVNRTDGRVGARGIIANVIVNEVTCGSTAEPIDCWRNAEAVGIQYILDAWNASIETLP